MQREGRGMFRWRSKLVSPRSFGPSTSLSSSSSTGMERRRVHRTFTVGASDDGIRASKFVLKKPFRDLLGSKSVTFAVLKAGLIVLDTEERAVELSRVLQQGDQVQLLDGFQRHLPSPALELRYEGKDASVFWKPAGVALVPEERATETSGSSPPAGFTYLFRPARGVATFVVQLRRDLPREEQDTLRSVTRATMRALVTGTVPEAVTLTTRDQDRLEVKPVEVTKTTTGAISTIDVSCDTRGVCAVKETLAFNRTPVITANQRGRKSPAKGTYLVMTSLVLSVDGETKSFTMEEPPKFRSLREREAKFWKEKEARLCGEDGAPMAYVRGSQLFDGTDFFITRAVMIPRKSTEALVCTAAENLLARNGDSCAKYRVLDLGTGSGNVLLSILRRVASATGVGLDKSPRAIEVAEENARRMQLQHRVQLCIADFGLLHDSDQLQSLTGAKDGIFDLIVCNPPYLSSARAPMQLDVSSFQHEPHEALIADQDGYGAYVSICSTLKLSREKAWPLLRDATSRIIVEIGVGTADRVEKIFFEQGNMILESSAKDFYGTERCLVFREASTPHPPGVKAQ